jgi:hypothetical protein
MEGTVRHSLGDARTTVSRQVKQRNCIRYYNKSCDSGAQKKTIQTIPLFGLVGNCTSVTFQATPMILKFCEKLTTSPLSSVQILYSTPYFCRPISINFKQA